MIDSVGLTVFEGDCVLFKFPVGGNVKVKRLVYDGGNLKVVKLRKIPVRNIEDVFIDWMLRYVDIPDFFDVLSEGRVLTYEDFVFLDKFFKDNLGEDVLDAYLNNPELAGEGLSFSGNFLKEFVKKRMTQMELLGEFKSELFPYALFIKTLPNLLVPGLEALDEKKPVILVESKSRQMRPGIQVLFYLLFPLSRAVNDYASGGVADVLLRKDEVRELLINLSKTIYLLNEDDREIITGTVESVVERFKDRAGQ